VQDIAREALINASKGDMKAFEDIYKATSGFVYSIAFRIVSSRADAEDITQEVFLKIYNNLKSFKFRSSFKTWVYRIAANAAINSYRKTSKEMSRRVDYDVAIKTVGSSGGTEEAVERIDNERILVTLLNRLNADQRACIVLREIQGLSYKEISDVLGININTVRSRLKRARIALLALRKKREVITNEL